MMGRALLVVGWIGTAGFVAAGVVGYRLPGAGLANHLLLGLVASLLLLFSHCWILFYLIGTGKAVKDAVREHGLSEDLVAATRRFKHQSNPWMLLAMLLAMATFIVGGGVQTQVVSTWVHHGLFLAALAAQLFTLAIEHRVLGANHRLLSDVDRLLRRAA
jgi:4-hydroxybenzoate polyprenyltransferase